MFHFFLNYQNIFVLCILTQNIYNMNNTKQSENEFFNNWSKKFLEYLDSEENPDFPNKLHRFLWGL